MNADFCSNREHVRAVYQPFIVVCHDFHLIMDSFKNHVCDHAVNASLTWFEEINILRTNHYIDWFVLSETFIHTWEVDSKNLDKAVLNHCCRNDIALSSYYVASIIKAYKTGKPIREIDNFTTRKIQFDHAEQIGNVKELVKNEVGKFLDYIEQQKTNFYSYRDYLDACQYLGLDMNEEKNRYPHDFKRWHDIRIDEYRSAKALKDEQKRKEFYDKFAAVASKYLGLEYDKKSVYIAVIAQNPSDLIREGELLHHCVGRMGYDQKFAREESLIFFIRTKEQPDVPFVTVEYSPKQKRVLQCYGDNDTKPDDGVIEFVNKKWLPYANRKIKQLAA